MQKLIEPGKRIRRAAEISSGAAADERADAALAAAGDIRAFERLYGRHAQRIHALCRRMLGDADADDATQEVFMRAWRKLGSFRGESAFGTWLYRLGMNLVLGRRAARAVRPHGAATVVVDRMPLAARGDRTDLRIDLEAALERLPDGARTVFVLHDVEGYTHDEIGDLLCVSPGTSKSQLHRARMALREYLR